MLRPSTQGARNLRAESALGAPARTFVAHTACAFAGLTALLEPPRAQVEMGILHSAWQIREVDTAGGTRRHPRGVASPHFRATVDAAALQEPLGQRHLRPQ